jgi:hypothetical protein
MVTVQFGRNIYIIVTRELAVAVYRFETPANI